MKSFAVDRAGHCGQGPAGSAAQQRVRMEDCGGRTEGHGGPLAPARQCQGHRGGLMGTGSPGEPACAPQAGHGHGRKRGRPHCVHQDAPLAYRL